MAIVSKCPEELQSHLNLLHDYCSTWGLEVSTQKKKIMVFRKRGRLLPTEHWTNTGSDIEVVGDFNYLGAVFHYTGNVNVNQEYLVGKALKGMNFLLNKCSEFDIKPKILCQLFDTFVGSILNYSCEIWGKSKSKVIERLHLKLCKRLVKVRSNTCNAAVYGELGRYPLYVNRYIRIIKYWLNVVNTDNILLKCVYLDAVEDCHNGCRNWVSNIIDLLNMYGFSETFDNVLTTNTNIFVNQFKTRVIDTYKSEWFASIESNSDLDMYNIYKPLHGYEFYLDIIPRSLRLFLINSICITVTNSNWETR